MSRRALLLGRPLRKRTPEVVSGDVHTLAQIEPMSAVALNPGVEMHLSTPFACRFRFEPGEQTPPKATRTSGLSRDQIIDIQVLAPREAFRNSVTGDGIEPAVYRPRYQTIPRLDHSSHGWAKGLDPEMRAKLEQHRQRRLNFLGRYDTNNFKFLRHVTSAGNYGDQGQKVAHCDDARDVLYLEDVTVELFFDVEHDGDELE